MEHTEVTVRSLLDASALHASRKSDLFQGIATYLELPEALSATSTRTDREDAVTVPSINGRVGPNGTSDDVVSFRGAIAAVATGLASQRMIERFTQSIDLPRAEVGRGVPIVDPREFAVDLVEDRMVNVSASFPFALTRDNTVPREIAGLLVNRAAWEVGSQLLERAELLEPAVALELVYEWRTQLTPPEAQSLTKKARAVFGTWVDQEAQAARHSASGLEGGLEGP